MMPAGILSLRLPAVLAHEGNHGGPIDESIWIQAQETLTNFPFVVLLIALGVSVITTVRVGIELSNKKRKTNYETKTETQ